MMAARTTVTSNQYSLISELGNKKKNMNNQFDNLAKAIAQSVTRRQALRKFGVGLAGTALACFGLADKASAKNGCKRSGKPCDPTRASLCCSGSCIDVGGLEGRSVWVCA
jgi:hypothetical protein